MLSIFPENSVITFDYHYVPKLHLAHLTFKTDINILNNHHNKI